MIERNDQGKDMKRYTPTHPDDRKDWTENVMQEHPEGEFYHVEEVDALTAPRPIDSAPKDGTPILLRYIKNGKNGRTRVSGVAVWTEARYLPPFFADWDTEKNHQYGDEWYDHLDRLICNMRSPSRKNIPTHWLPLPPEVK